MIQKSSDQLMYLKIKIHPTSFRCALKNFKIDINIAIDKTHSHADRIHWAITQFFFMKWSKCNASVAKQKISARGTYGQSIKLAKKTPHTNFKNICYN
jgi:hypothetical protein